MTESRVKGEGGNKVKLRGQKIPAINMARKVPFLRGRVSIYRKKEKETHKGKKASKSSTSGVHLVNVPAPPGRAFHASGDPFVN